MIFDAKMAQKRNGVWLQALQCLFVQIWFPLCILQSTTAAVNSKHFFGFIVVFYCLFGLPSWKIKQINIFSLFYFFFLASESSMVTFPQKTWCATSIEIKLQNSSYQSAHKHVFCLVHSVAGQKLHRLVWLCMRCLDILGVQMPSKYGTPMPASKVGYPL